MLDNPWYNPQFYRDRTNHKQVLAILKAHNPCPASVHPAGTYKLSNSIALEKKRRERAIAAVSQPSRRVVYVLNDSPLFKLLHFLRGFKSIRNLLSIY